MKNLKKGILRKICLLKLSCQILLNFCRLQELNQAHKDFQSFALPSELRRHLDSFANPAKFCKKLYYRIKILNFLSNFRAFFKTQTVKIRFLPFVVLFCQIWSIFAKFSRQLCCRCCSSATQSQGGIGLSKTLGKLYSVENLVKKPPISSWNRQQSC